MILTGQAQTAAPNLSAAGLKEDIDVLERTYKALHPGLYRYQTPARLDAAFALLRKELRREQPLNEAYLRISEFLAKINCGHTYANFYNQPDAIAKELFDKSNKVPFTFRWVKKTIVVTSDSSTEGSFPRGTEILEIDGVSTPRILSKLMRVARADGANDAKRVADLEVLGTSRYEAFDVFFSLYYPPTSNTRAFKVRKPGSRDTQVVVSTLVSSSARRAGNQETDPGAPVWKLSYPRKDVACLTMPTWAMYNRKWDWKGFLEATFDELAAGTCPNLVIDLRGNEGGDSVGDLLLPRFVRSKVASEDYVRKTRYRTVPQEIRANLSTWDSSFFDWGTAAQPEAGGFFRLTRFDDQQGNVISPSARPYLGKLFVLIGPENSSATFEFAHQVQRLRLGTLVGRPTGGSLRGINGGAFFFLSLPNSKIEVDVPLIAQHPIQKQPDRGVVPDIAVEPTPASIAQGQDVELERVFELIDTSR